MHSSPVGSSPAAQAPPAQDTPAPVHDTSVSPTISRTTTNPAAEEPSSQTHSTVRLLTTTAQCEPPSGDSVNDSQSPTISPRHSPLTTPDRLEWWKPWQISWLWLLILFLITIFLALTIFVLVLISSKEQGFTPLWNPPAFLARLPAFENNIWSQGVLFTSLPAFFMTLYSISFSSIVTCFMDLQPHMDLAGRYGATARTTIMLDYRRYPMFVNACVAFRNKHFLLGVYMLLSTALTIAVIPLTAFLFVASPVNVNTTAPISFITSFDESLPLEFPDFGLAVEFAAAFRIFDASPPPWTDGEYAFPKVVPVNTNTEEITNSNLTVETTGYSAYIDCRIIPEEEYNLKVVYPIGAPIQSTIVIQISANDRGCAISHDFTIQNRSAAQTDTTIIESWPTEVCTIAAGYSRLSIASALYAETLTNFSLISCIPSYWTTPGTLTMTMASLAGPPLIQSFSANDNQAVESRFLANYFELTLQEIFCFDPTSDVNSFVYGGHIYVLASKNNHESPLLPEAISNAAQTLFTSIYAVLVSTSILQKITPPTNSTGILTTSETRLVVMVPIAYTIVAILCVIVLAIGTMFWYRRKPNVLDEEPTGLLSSALILHGGNITKLMNKVHEAHDSHGEMRKRLKGIGIVPDTEIIVQSYNPLRVIVPSLENGAAE
jgi:hypothetical protein